MKSPARWYVARVVLFDFQRNESLRAMIRILSGFGFVTLHRDDSETVFDILPPVGCTSTREFACDLSTLLTAENINAVIAPEFV